jgi:hypothetical protein
MREKSDPRQRDPRRSIRESNSATPSPIQDRQGHLLIPVSAHALEHLPNPIPFLRQVVVHQRLEHPEHDVLGPLLGHSRALRLNGQCRINESVDLSESGGRRKEEEGVLERLRG